MTTEKPRISDLGPEIDLVAVGRVLWMRKWIVGGFGLLFAAAAATYSLLVTPIYRSEVTITEARDGSMGAAASLASQFGGLASLAGIDLNGSSNRLEARAVLRSRKLAENFILRYKLTDVILPRTVKAHTTWRAVERFRASILTLRDETRSGTQVVSIDWKDPKTAAIWANHYVALANEIVRQRAIEDSSRNIAYLNEQLKNTSSLEIQKVMFRLIETETKNSMLANGRVEYAFTVVDAAVAPELRLSPKRTLLTIGGGLFGLLVGSLFVFARGLIRPQS